MTQNAFKKIENISMIYLNPQSTYIKGKATAQKLWIIEGTNVLPPSAKVAQALDLLPIIIEKNQEIIIRDAVTNKLLMAVFRN